MNYITKDELENKDLICNFSLHNGELVFDENCIYKSSFEVGDIVSFRKNPSQIGVVSFIEDEEDDNNLNIILNNNQNEIASLDDLVIIPPTIGSTLLTDSSLLKSWEELSNGKSDSFDLKCLYINDHIINEVPFIKAYKNTDTIVDKKFKRKFSLYRKFANTQIFRTNLYSIVNGTCTLDNSRFVYYLLQDHVVYYLGIDLTSSDLSTYLFKK